MNPPTASLVSIQSLHDIYNNDYERLKTAFEGREQARLEREAELKANPPQPKNSATWPLVTWHGIAASTTEPEITWKIGNPTENNWQAAELPVKVKVMKRRTVKVAVWLVSLLKSDGSEKPPVVKPSKEELDEYLNGALFPQVNATFDCTVTETAPIDFDNAEVPV